MYYLPFDRDIALGQPYGALAGLFPNPPKGHNGDDWLTPTGTLVRAAGDGTVVFAGQFDDTYADNFGWNLNYGGLMVVLNMDGETAPYFEYGHNSKLLVKTNDRVRAGQGVALTGATDGGTGVVTGPHSHVGCLPWNYQELLGNGTYGRVNPRLYMTKYWDGGNIAAVSSTINTDKDEFMASIHDFMNYPAFEPTKEFPKPPTNSEFSRAVWYALFNNAGNNESILGGFSIPGLGNHNAVLIREDIKELSKKLK